MYKSFLFAVAFSVFSILIFLSLYFSLPAHATFGIGQKTFGGRVGIPRLDIVCPGGVEVFGFSHINSLPSPIPYYISFNTSRFLHYTATPGRWMLGIRNIVPTMCVKFNFLLPPTPTPAYRVKMFGTSPF